MSLQEVGQPAHFFMLMRTIQAELHRMAASVVAPLGCQLWGIELLPRAKSGQLLRVYIDKPDGVDLDDCTKVSRQLSALLDVEDPIAGEYVLEVSSPGMDRPLFTPEQFAALRGSQIRVKLQTTATGRKNYRGRLAAVADEYIELTVDEEPFKLLFADIDSAHVVPEF